MILLIDGFNLMYKFPDLEEKMLRGHLDEACGVLLDRLREFQRIRRSRIRIVFDGVKRLSPHVRRETVNGIDVYYSLDYSADFLIKQFIKKDPNPRMTTVVTSDKDILAYVSRFKARTMTSEKFADYCNRTIEEHEEAHARVEEKEENPRLSDEEVTFWERLFRSRNKSH